MGRSSDGYLVWCEGGGRQARQQTGMDQVSPVRTRDAVPQCIARSEVSRPLTPENSVFRR